MAYTPSSTDHDAGLHVPDAAGLLAVTTILLTEVIWQINGNIKESDVIQNVFFIMRKKNILE